MQAWKLVAFAGALPAQTRKRVLSTRAPPSAAEKLIRPDSDRSICLGVEKPRELQCGETRQSSNNARWVLLNVAQWEGPDTFGWDTPARRDDFSPRGGHSI